MTRKEGSMHVDTRPRTYRAVDGSVREYQQALLRRSYRNAQGKPAKETLANLSMLPAEAVEVLRKSLAGKILVDLDEAFDIEHVVAHGHVAAVHAMASQLKFDELLGPRGRERDLAYALIVSRVVAPQSKLSTIRWWADTSLGVDLGIAAAHTDEVYAAMDWLLARQDRIEKKLAGRHLISGGMALFDLSSTWMEGHCCELSRFGYSRDGKRGLPQIEFGLLGDAAGRPVAVRVFEGNTSDSRSFLDAISAVRDQFGLQNVTMVGDRGMITNARIKDLKALSGMDWITALRAPAVAALARQGGPLQMSLFDTQNFAEITHRDFPGERLACCRNPALADERARKRNTLLHATEQNLDKIMASVTAGRLRGADQIGIRVGKVINKNKVGKHFITTITDEDFSYRRDEHKITAEATLDGIYVIRTSVHTDKLDTVDLVGAYKNLAHIERDFRSIKSDDLDLRPVRHYLTDRVKAHILLCMLAAYLNWHLRRALAPLTFTDENIPQPNDPVAPAQRSPEAKAKDAAKQTQDGLPIYDHPGLIAHLGQLTRNTISFAGQHFDKIAHPTPVQRRAFELLNASIPLTLTGK
ncbi:MAG TPA: IS1634 family transposase [Actinophytocola sp.]|uniref:IS1634 family transposase n=1 Tax=Actinophytocola sp. TaxID=1872138 RepID=UPI002DFAB692|nr:IS1634 family transposase [Actinophytocola sp.]